MNVCNIKGCKESYEARGYCKSHYKSFMKYGNPLQVEINKAYAEEKRRTSKINKRILYSTDGICSVKECKNPIKARRMCDMHHKRVSRTGATKLKSVKKGSIEECLVIGCNSPHKSHGYCDTHASYYKQNGTPYSAKVIKLCAVKECEEKHWGKGLCRGHFLEWKKELRKYGLE